MSTHTPHALHMRRRMAVETRHLYVIRWWLRVVLALVVIGGLALWTHLQAEQIRDAQVRACERGNTLRAQVSRDQRILRAFLEESARVIPPTLKIGTVDSAREYLALRDRLAPIPLIDCDQVVRG